MRRRVDRGSPLPGFARCSSRSSGREPGMLKPLARGLRHKMETCVALRFFFAWLR